MRYFCNTTDFYSDGPTAVTLGKFDGLHRGHQKLIEEILRLGSKEEVQTTVFALASDERPYLLSPEEKKERLERYNIDYLIRCPFIPEILGMEPETFVKEVLKERLHAKYVVVGTDFHFGHNRKGDADFLKTLEEAYDMKVIVMENECFNGREISSTYIR